ncbi:MAG: DUF2029 domain-containing protein [Candidatus Methanomethylophilaceae archaeon]|nr:DUF2029 domain-containing protein [Candidatus Methanomethylophilaceae archaeon]
MAAVLAAGIALRLALSLAFSYDYDVHHWAIVMANMASGNDLYGLSGYFYTPVWGYVLGSMELFQQLVLGVGDWGTRVADALVLESYPDSWISAYVTTTSFALSVKGPLFAVDAVVMYLVHRCVMDLTGDRRKAETGAALWFLCPLTIASPAVQGMFDDMSAMLVLLTVMLALRRRYFLGGCSIALAALLKLFPAALVPLLVVFILRKEGRDGFLRPLVSAIAGGLATCLVVYIPQILTGTVRDSFSFILDRASSTDLVGTLTVGTYVLIVVLILGLALVYLRREERDEGRLLVTATMIAIGIVFLCPPAPQYLVLLIPFVAIYMALNPGKLRAAYAVMSVGGLAFTFLNTFSLMLGASYYHGIPDMGMILSFMAAIGPHMRWVFLAMTTFQYVGILLMMLHLLREDVMGVRSALAKALRTIRFGPQGRMPSDENE